MRGVKMAFALGIVFFCREAGAEMTAAAAMLKTPLSVRQMGMGDVSLGRNDILRAWCNPSLAAMHDSRGMVAASGASSFDAEDAVLGLGVGYRFTPGFAMGALMSSYIASVAEINSLGDLAGNSLDRQLLSGGVVAAFRPSEWLAVGVTCKGVRDQVIDDVATVVAVDTGFTSVWKNFSIGAAFRNLGQELRTESGLEGEGEVLPRELRAGILYGLDPYGLVFGVEYAEADERDGRLNAGAEWAAGKWFSLRAGFLGVQTEGRQLTFGLSAGHGGVGVDYAFTSHTLGATHRACVSYAFGAVEHAELEEAGRPFYTSKTLVPSAVRRGPRMHLAVLSFAPRGGSVEESAEVAGWVREEYGRGRGFSVLSVEGTDELLTAMNVNQQECITGDCVRDIGKTLNVDQVVTGTLWSFPEGYTLSVRVMDSETGIEMHKGSLKGATLEEIRESLPSFVDELLE